MRRLGGFLLVIFRLVLLGWIGYNLFIERLPETKDTSPIAAVIMAIGCLAVGYKWMRGQR